MGRIVDWRVKHLSRLNIYIQRTMESLPVVWNAEMVAICTVYRCSSKTAPGYTLNYLKLLPSLSSRING